MSKLMISPDQDSYTLSPGAGSRSANYGGGESRYRRGLRRIPTVIPASWTLTVIQYDYFMAFYRASTVYCAKAFTIDLVLESDEVAEYTARLVPGSLSLSGKAGNVFFVEAELEVEVPLPDESADALLVASYA